MRGFAGSPSASMVRARGTPPWRSARSRRQWPWLSSSASGSSRGLNRFGPRTAARSHSGRRAPKMSTSAAKSGELPGDRRRGIDESCEAFVMLPGMNSFYIWTQQEPPTGYNATGWSTEFDSAHQQRVIEDTRAIDGFSLLEGVPLARFWGAGAGISPGPLVRYLHHRFVPIAKFGDYELLKREGSGSRS